FGFERGFDSYRFLKDARAEYVVDAGLHLALESRGRRHFLFLHLFDAHWPYLPPREFLDRFDQRPPDISDIMPKIIYGKRPREPGEIQQFVNLYDGEIAYLDQQLGRFFEGLREAGLYDRSLILLTADHGESFYEHGMWQHSESLYQEVTHVPLIVKWPGGSPSGKVEHLVSQLHIFPTILERAGIDSPYADHQGLDRYASGEEPDPQSGTAMSEIIWEPKETHGPSMKVSLRKDSLKYIVTLTSESGEERFLSEVVSEELYDLSQDPGERSNLLPDTARDVGELRREVRQFIDQAQILQAERQGQEVVLDDELREQLKALGYIN
ncbi:MAG TPA: sulfatase-like hydrolase/transferase, partial [Vicinamibacteria bacterium]